MGIDLEVPRKEKAVDPIVEKQLGFPKNLAEPKDSIQSTPTKELARKEEMSDSEEEIDAEEVPTKKVFCCVFGFKMDKAGGW